MKYQFRVANILIDSEHEQCTEYDLKNFHAFFQFHNL